MRRTLIIYAFIVAVLSAVVFRGLTTFGESMIEYWEIVYQNDPEGWGSTRVPALTMVAPWVAQAGMVFSCALFVLAGVSLKRSWYGEKRMIHGIAIVAIAQAAIAFFSLVTSFIPSLQVMTAMPMPVPVEQGQEGGAAPMEKTK